MNTHRTSKRAFTLVELLVVIAVITIITAITIPAAIRSGLFNSRETAIAGREMFETLRAAKIYAATNNVETAVVYAGTTRLDSESLIVVPVIDAVALVQRMSPAALTAAGIVGPPFPVFEPLGSTIGNQQDLNFEVMRDDNCILPDIFEVDGAGINAKSVVGLSTILVWEGPLDTDFYAPRSAYNVMNPALNVDTFPAHRLLPSGGVEPEPTMQRLIFRLGLLPDQDKEDRYPEEKLAAVIGTDEEPIFVWFQAALPVAINLIHHPDRDDPVIFPDRVTLADPNAFDLPLEYDIELFLYTATGRVKVAQ